MSDSIGKMKPTFSSTSPIAYQVPLTSRSQRPADVPRNEASHDSRDIPERLMKKQSRSSDEGTSGRRSSRSHSMSRSSLFSQQNVTLEDIHESTPPSTAPSNPISPTVLTPRPVSLSRSVKSTPRSPPQALIRATAQQGTFQHPKVEVDVELLVPDSTHVSTVVPKPLDSVKPTTPPSSTLATVPVSAQQKASIKHEPTSAEHKVDERVHYPAPSSSTKVFSIEHHSQARRSLDDSLSSSRQQETPLIDQTVYMAASAISPSQSPRLHCYNPYSYQTGYVAAPPPSDSQRSSPAPPPMMPPMNYSYMPMVAGGPPTSIYGNPYYGMPFPPPVEPTNEGVRSPISSEAEHTQLLEKVAGVLPDINRLINNYKETHGQLSAKELLVKEADLSHNEERGKLKVELEANKKEYEKVIQNLVGEKGKLSRELASVRQRTIDLEKMEAETKAMRLEVEALQLSKKDLSEGFDTIRRSKEEMQTIRLAHEKEIESLKNALQAEKDLHHRNLVEAREQAKEQMNVKQKELNRVVGDHKLSYTKVQQDLASLLAKHNSQKKDLDAARHSEVNHKNELDLKSKEVEEMLATHGQEIRSNKKKHEEDQERMAQEGEERIAKISQIHSNKERQWRRDLHDINKEAELEKAESRRLLDELNAMKKSREAEKLQKSAELVECLGLWRSKSDELQKENQNLGRLLQGLGYGTEPKSKGVRFLEVSTCP